MLRVRGRMGEVHVLCCCRPEVGYAYACLLTGHTATATGETSNRKDVHRIPCSLETFPADRFPRKALHIIISEDGRRKYIYIYIYVYREHRLPPLRQSGQQCRRRQLSTFFVHGAAARASIWCIRCGHRHTNFNDRTHDDNSNNKPLIKCPTTK